MKPRFPLICLVLILALFMPSCSPSQKGERNSNITSAEEDLRVLIVIADKDFNEFEYRTVRDILSRTGADITVASPSSHQALGMSGTRLTPDIIVSKAEAENYDAIVFIGGTGLKRYWSNRHFLRLARDAVQKEKILGAICWAPVILANAGVLKGKKCTVAPMDGAADIVTRTGGIYTASHLTVDGRIITADSPPFSEGFAKAIAQKLERE